MKLITLIENTTAQADLTCEHGLSLYIETGTHRILFDAGQSTAFADNAEKLGIDLAKVDFAILSHGHYDHSGGLLRFLELNPTAPIYLHRDAFEPHFNAADKDIGLPPALRDSDRLIFTDDYLEIAPGITLYSCNDRNRPHPADTAGLQMLEHGQLCPDDFRHEQYLLLEENGKTICISGCSHKGILNITDWFQPDILVGGFHFMKLDPDRADAEFLSTAAEQLLQYPTTYYTGHCTGDAPYAFLKGIMGNHLHSLTTGSVLTL